MYLASLASVFDLIYSHLPGGSLFNFLLGLPGSTTATTTLFSLPYSSNILHALNNLGVLG